MTMYPFSITTPEAIEQFRPVVGQHISVTYEDRYQHSGTVARSTGDGAAFTAKGWVLLHTFMDREDIDQITILGCTPVEIKPGDIIGVDRLRDLPVGSVFTTTYKGGVTTYMVASDTDGEHYRNIKEPTRRALYVSSNCEIVVNYVHK